MKKGRKLKNKKSIGFLLLTVFSMVIFLQGTITVYASDTDRGWYTQKNIYGTSSSSSGSGATEDDDDPGPVIRWIAELIYNLGNSIDANILSSGTIDLSIDGIIMGRVGGANPSYAQFDLAKGNPYGIIGAWIYVAFRTMVFSFFLIYFVFFLIPHLFREGNKGRAELKEFIPKVVFYYFMLFALPYIVDYFIYFRDVLMKYSLQVVNTAITGNSGVGNSLLQVYINLYESRRSIMNAFLYLATVCAGMFFFADYLGTALIEMICFGLSPMVFLLAPRNKKLVESWANTFFMNLLIPLIDSILILVPAFILYIYNSNRGAQGLAQASVESPDVGSSAIYVIMLLCIWAVKPSRNGIMRALGAVTGTQPRAGLGGLMGLAGMALMHAMRGKGKSSGGDSEHGDSLKENVSEAREAKSESEALAAANSMNDGSSDIDNVLGGGAEKSNDDLENVGSGDNRTEEEKMDDFINEGPDERPDDGGIEDDVESSEDAVGVSNDEGVDNLSDLDGITEEQTAAMDAEEQMHSDGSNASDWMDKSEYYDSDFASGLNGVDGDRYTNLAARDEMQSRIDANNSSMQANAQEMAKLDDKIADYKAQINTPEFQQMERENEALSRDINRATQDQLRANGINPSTATAEQKAAARQMAMDADSSTAARVHTLESNHEKMASVKTGLAEAQSQRDALARSNAQMRHQNQDLRAGVERATARERNYAGNAQAAGMSGKTFSSASGFQQQAIIDNNRRKQMNFRNFDSGKFEGLVSPEQRVKYARQRATIGTATKVASTAIKAAGVVAVGSVGATAAAYGGPSAMQKGASAAILGGVVVSKAGTKVVSTGGVVASEVGRATAHAVKKIDKRLGSPLKDAGRVATMPVRSLGAAMKETVKPSTSHASHTTGASPKQTHGGAQADYNKTFDAAKRAADKAIR